MNKLFSSVLVVLKEGLQFVIRDPFGPIVLVGCIIALGVYGLSGAAHACPPQAIGYGQSAVGYQQGYAAKQVQASYYAAPAVTYYPQAIYPFRVGYVPPSSDSSLTEELLKLKIEVQQLQLEALKAKLPPEPLPAKLSAVAQVFANRCASCHDEKKAEKSGNGLVLLKGGLPVQLSAELRLKVISQLIQGKMPKGGPPLSNEEASSVVQELSGK